VVVTAPVDYLSWTQPLDRFVSQPEIAGPLRTLHLAGAASGRTRAELSARGWALHEHSPLFTPLVERVGEDP
jgi:hypothetical protein